MGILALLNLVAALASALALDVNTEKDFLVGLGSPLVSHLRLAADISLGSDTAWVAAALPLDDQHVYLLTRNLTVTTASPAASCYPTLDVSMVTAGKIQVATGVVLTFQHVILRGASVGITPYNFIDARSAGLVQNLDVVQVLAACPPPSSALQFISTYPRPAAFPGSQAVLLPTSSICVPSLTSSASLQCWQTSFLLLDVAFSTGPGLYDVHNANFSLACEQVVSEECIEAMGLANCTAMLSGPGLGAVPPLPPGPPCQGAAAGAAGGMSAGLIAGVVVAAVGGVALLVLLLGLVLWRRRAGEDSPGDKARHDLEASPQHGSGSMVAFRSLDSSVTTPGKQDDVVRVVSLSLAPAACAPSWKLSSKQASVADAVAAAPVSTSGKALDDSATPMMVLAPEQGQGSTTSSSPYAAWGAGYEFNHMDLVKELSDRSQRAALKSAAQDSDLAFHNVIGSSAYGTVYRGSWKGLHVAIKSIMFTSDSPAGGLAKNHSVLMEAALSRSISHPNVVITFSCDLKSMSVDKDSALGTGGPTGLQVNAQASTLQHWRLFIIQELCSGGSLRDAIENHSLASHRDKIPEIPLDVLLALASGLASGMCYLHSRNVIHGDLNPSNVLLQEEGDRMIPKVCDFGLSIHLSSSRSHVSNARRGTPFYMAPELAQHGSLSKASDVYALGVMLWELYMGMVVWTVSSYGQLVMHSTFPRMPRGTPAAYSELVAACVSPAPTDRPTVAAALATLQAMAQEHATNAAIAAAQASSSDNMGSAFRPAAPAAPAAGPGGQPADPNSAVPQQPRNPHYAQFGPGVMRNSAMEASQINRGASGAPGAGALDNLQSA